MLLRPLTRVFFRSSFRYRRAHRCRRLTMLAVLTIFIFLTTPFYFVYKPPQFIIRYLQRRGPDVLWHVSTSSKVVALTIDDTPSQYTSEMVQILKENDARATWFVIGNQVPGREKVLDELVQNGNELANHAMRDETSKSLSDDVLREQIVTVEGMIRQAYASVDREEDFPKYFRPGGGFFNRRMQDLLARLGYRLVLGDIYPHDPFVSYWRVNARHILSMLHPGGIIICHDRRSWTPPMLREVLPKIRRQGYRIVTVTELLEEHKREMIMTSRIT
ncbi:polysaccharide deacetylase [Coccidioides immitis RS]|uniref:chitin deacetylase n=3 Tax=Coccidioides immitis TaxID=5501 RepID=A0A0E1S097_COCIM|nr:polysaccharide deacetylase [Coccidioides immitis RS]EAS36960.2 polysaccharide deacetylase [Coccidioides immitis RS]